MPRDHYNDLLAFIAVARERSFTRAAAQLGVSQSALSHVIRALEAKMGVRLLTRTTRSVSVTEAGERLLRNVAPRFEEIEAELVAVGDLGDKATGTVRITASENSVDTVLWPKLAEFLPRHPEINVEVTVDNRLTDIITERYDMGIRLGDEIAKDMSVVRIGPEMRVAIVASPAYLSKHQIPLRPQDLSEHTCINLRLMTHGDLYAWELRKDKQRLSVRVEGQLVFNGTRQILDAALAGFGLGYIPEDTARPYLLNGQLRQVLEDWCGFFPGFHLYYPNRHRISRAMTVLIEALRYPASDKQLG